MSLAPVRPGRDAIPEQRAPRAVPAPSAGRRPRTGAWLRASIVWLRRHAGVRELLLIAVVYGLYDVSRFFVQGRRASAIANALSVLHLEKLTNLDLELWLNQVVSAHTALAVVADYTYASLHYLVTPIVLVWLWRRHRSVYGRARMSLVVATVIGLIGFTLLPVAPPRMLPGFVDTMAKYSAAGWWGGDASAPRGVGSLTNEFAAMPSLHVGWALWCGWQLVRYAQMLAIRVAGGIYPALTTVVVMATANHYFLDAVAGMAVIVAASLAVTPAYRRKQRHVIDLTATTPSLR